MSQLRCPAAGPVITRITLAAFAGLRVPGQLPPATVSRLLGDVDETYDRLQSKHAVLFGRETCIWTQRQRALIGRRADAVTYVDCDKDKSRCQGVVAVPAWRIGAGGPIVLGFQRLPQLQELAHADGATLERLSQRSVSGLPGGGEACV